MAITKEFIGFYLCLFICMASCSLSGKPESAILRNSITQYGITWTFDGDYPSGQYVSGDYWVKGPLRIIAITPGSTITGDGRTINGSMLNPEISENQGYDSALFGLDAGGSLNSCQYVSALNCARPHGNTLSPQNPLVVDAEASLVSAISFPDLPLGTANRVRLFAVLTVVHAIPEENSFRPPYVGSDKRARHTLDEADRSRLPALPPPETRPDVDEVASRFEKPWIEHRTGWLKELFLAPDNQDNYGREIASDVSDAALLLTLNVEKTGKELLMRRLIQLGLDYYGIILEPNGRTNWQADGGHMPGRAFPLLFAGFILHDSDMLGLMRKSGGYAYENGYFEGNLPPDYIHFGEIDQTFRVTARDVARTAGPTWSPDERDVAAGKATPYALGDIGMAEWGIVHAHWPQADNKHWDAIYRPVNSEAWSGFVLASRILGIRNEWNHEPLFDYVDRWMSAGGGSAANEFQKTMWTAYRPDY